MIVIFLMVQVKSSHGRGPKAKVQLVEFHVRLHFSVKVFDKMKFIDKRIFRK